MYPVGITIDSAVAEPAAEVVERIRAEDAGRVPEFLDLWFRDETRSRIRAIVDGLSSRS